MTDILKMWLECLVKPLQLYYVGKAANRYPTPPISLIPKLTHMNVTVCSFGIYNFRSGISAPVPGSPLHREKNKKKLPVKENMRKSEILS